MNSTFLLPVYNEMRKGLLLIWDYKFSMLMQIVTFGMIFLGISFMMGNGKLVPALIAPALVGYMIWFLATLAINDMSWNLQGEAQTGTLEQMFMGAASMSVIVLGRVLIRLIFSIVTVGSMSVIMVIMLDVPVTFPPSATVPLVITLAGLLGFGYLVAGATLVFKQIGTLASILTNMMLFLNGSLLPVDRMPDGMARFARLLPTTEGIIVMRQVMIDGLSLAQTWETGALGALINHSLVFVVMGLLGFRYCENLARRRGTLGQY